MTSWHPFKFLFFFFRPSICYRFYRTGLALYMHIYYLWVLHLWMWKQMYLKAFKSHEWLRSWVTILQTEVLSAPHGHIHYGTEASLYRILWPFLSVMFHGLSSTCSPWHFLLETRFYLLDTRSSAASGFQPQPLGICLRCLRMRSESVNTDCVWAFPQGQAGILMSFLF